MRYLLPIILLLLIIGCPKPDEQLDPAICDDGYYPCGPDSQECCLDTTSHEFTWEIDTLGDYGSYLNDVAIISEDDIWVVGKIKTDSITYNTAHWDGREWEISRILRPVDFEGVFAFSQNDIWFVDGCKIFHYDGQDFTEMWMCDWQQYGVNQVTSAWGTSSSNMYFVGNGGSIVHYDGTTFSRMESEIMTDLKRIAGSSDGNHIFATGYSYISGHNESVTLSFTNNHWETLLYADDYLGDVSQLEYGRMSAVDVFGDTCSIVSKEGLIKYNFINETFEVVPPWKAKISGHDFEAISVESNADIMIFGFRGFISHYNGATWSLGDQLDSPRSVSAWFNSGKLKNNLAAMVGIVLNYEDNAGALVALGHR